MSSYSSLFDKNGKLAIEKARQTKKRRAEADKAYRQLSQKKIKPETLPDDLSSIDTPTLHDFVSEHDNENARKELESRLSDGLYRRINLTHDQAAVYDAVGSGKNVFFTGPAGTGKSMLLRTIIQATRELHGDEAVAVTGPTGVAAVSIRGDTLHGWLGLTARVNGGRVLARDIVNAVCSSKEKLKIWQNHLKLLIIDEISMLEGSFFQELESAARTIRKCNKAWGGVQVLFSGDFCQLPPVRSQAMATTNNDTQKKYIAAQRPPFVFEQEAWHYSVDEIHELSTVVRQRDALFVALLTAVRKGELCKLMIQTLNSRSIKTENAASINGPRLYARKAAVNDHNAFKFGQLRRAGKRHAKWNAYDTGDKDARALLASSCKYDSVLSLAVGARVMLRKKLDIENGLVNGTLGVIVDIEGPESTTEFTLKRIASQYQSYDDMEFNVWVRWDCDPESDYLLFPATHTIYDAMGKPRASRTQLPVCLAWAFSIHKAQGITLTCPAVVVDLENVFCAGMSYVALSRVQRLDQLYITGFKPNKIRIHPIVQRYLLYMHSWLGHSKVSILKTLYPFGWKWRDRLSDINARPERNLKTLNKLF